MKTLSAQPWATSVLNAAYGLGLYYVVDLVFGGCGVIFSLHRVIEPQNPTVHPVYMIHSDALDVLLETIAQLGWEFISIDEVYHRLTVDAGPRRAKPDQIRK